jgi:hypothetical protein
MSDEVVEQGDVGLGDVFSSGLPSMVGIVVAVAQPAVQARDSLGWPAWLAYALALAASSALAYYRIRILRRSAPGECVILVPLLALVIFSAYVAGNNVVFYTKEGYSRPAPGAGPTNADLSALRTETDLLNQKLQNAEEVIKALRQVVPGAAGKAQTPLSLFSPIGTLLRPDSAWAQGPVRQPEERRQEKPTPQQVHEMLKDYDARQRDLDQKLKATQTDKEKSRMQQQTPPLLKSW